MGLEEYKGVYIYAQQVDNKLSDIAFESVSYTHLDVYKRQHMCGYFFGHC